MIELSIITINYNNQVGLEHTFASVLEQQGEVFEHVVVDGGSTDGSAEVIGHYVARVGGRYEVKWVSEPDGGIYQAMNKGIGMANGRYVQFLNSGDSLAHCNVVQQMMITLRLRAYPDILVGNMLKLFPDGHVYRDEVIRLAPITFLTFFQGTLNHSSSYIARKLFALYGGYDEQLKIVSDWKWFMQAVVLHGVEPILVDIDVSRFDMSGISESQLDVRNLERDTVLTELFPDAVLSDYKRWSFAIGQKQRLERHPWANSLCDLLERVLYKCEKWR